MFSLRLSLSRQADGQGMALGCLLVPTVLCSTLHCSLYTASQQTGESVVSMVLYILSVAILSMVLYILSVDIYTIAGAVVYSPRIDNMYVWTNELCDFYHQDTTGRLSNFKTFANF